MNDRNASGEMTGNAVNVQLRSGRVVDISLELDDKTFKMQVLEGFKFDMQFKVELMKSHDADKGLGQVVRGVHMRLHAGSHIDAPEHFVKGSGEQTGFVLADLLRPEGVITALRNRPGHFRQREDRAGDLPLQGAGDYQRHQHRPEQDQQGNPAIHLQP